MRKKKYVRKFGNEMCDIPQIIFCTLIELCSQGTKSILAIPCVDANNNVVAVIQMINKKEFDGMIGEFDEGDENVMEIFASFVGNRLSHSSLLRPQGGSGVESEGEKAFGGSSKKSHTLH